MRLSGIRNYLTGIDRIGIKNNKNKILIISVGILILLSLGWIVVHKVKINDKKQEISYLVKPLNYSFDSELKKAYEDDYLDLPTIKEAETTVFKQTKPFTNQVEKYEVKKLESRKLSDYRNKKWGYPKNSLFLYETDDTTKAIEQIVYVIKRIKNVRDFFFMKSSYNTMLIYEDYEKEFSLFQSSKKYVLYKIQDKCLWLNFNGEFEKVFERKKISQGLPNFYGKSFFNQHYKKIEFMNYTFKDIYEFYLIDLRSSYPREFLIWFDKNFNLVRFEKISEGTYNMGKIYINQNEVEKVLSREFLKNPSIMRFKDGIGKD